MTGSWVAACGALAAFALLVHALPASARLTWDWQPALAWAEPWRWWTAAFVHYGLGHLAMNLAGCAALAIFGAAARLEWRWTLAWATAWPLGHLMLLGAPQLAHYGGLSGLLHAGVAVAAVALMTGLQGARERGAEPLARRRRATGVAVAAGLLVKLLVEQTSGPAGPGWPGLQVPVATAAHWRGALGGALCAGLAVWIARRGDTIRP